jgi:hypothetical protein
MWNSFVGIPLAIPSASSKVLASVTGARRCIRAGGSEEKRGDRLHNRLQVVSHDWVYIRQSVIRVELLWVKDKGFLSQLN